MLDKSHDFKLKIGDIDIKGDVYTTDGKAVYCKLTSNYIIPDRYSDDLDKLFDILTNLTTGFGEIKKLKVIKVGEED